MIGMPKRYVEIAFSETWHVNKMFDERSFPKLTELQKLLEVILLNLISLAGIININASKNLIAFAIDFTHKNFIWHSHVGLFFFKTGLETEISCCMSTLADR